jgi:predicted dehydrogenase
MSKKPSIAVCGIGQWGKNLARHFHELGALTVICDRRPELLKAAAGTYRAVRMESSFDALLEDASIDAVVVAAPTPEHYLLAKKALTAGKHVFVEKPLALQVEHARELCRLAKRAKRKLMVGHLLLYHPAVLKLKEMIRSKELGELYYLYTQRLNLGSVRKDENAMWSLAPHDISVLLELFPSKPISVSATGQSYIQRTKGIEDVIFMNFAFADGKSAHIHLSWLDPHKVRRITLVGSKKMVVFDDMEQTEKLRIFDKGVDIDKSTADSALASAMVLRVGDVQVPYIDNIEPLRAECAHFIDCIANDKRPRSDGENGLEVLKVLAAASRSLKSGGKSVRLSA